MFSHQLQSVYQHVRLINLKCPCVISPGVY